MYVHEPRRALLVTLAALALAAGSATAQAQAKPDCTIAFEIFKAGFIVGGSGGSGTLTCQGKTYPLNIGGRPLVSLPSFIIPAFELTILVAALTAVFGTLIMCGFPQPYHPVFNVKRFRERGSIDGLFLCVEADDPKFDAARTRDTHLS